MEESLKEIIKGTESLKEGDKTAVLIIADKDGTSVTSHGLSSVYDVIITLAVAQSAMVGQLPKAK